MTDRDDAIKSFLGKLSVRDLRGLARGRKVEEYKTMKKKDLAGHLFDKHFMQKQDKEQFAPKEKDEKENPVPNFATAPKGLARRGVRDFARGTVVAEGARERPQGLVQEAPVFVSPGAKRISVAQRETKEEEERKAREREREEARQRGVEQARALLKEKERLEKERAESKRQEEVRKEARRLEREKARNEKLRLLQESQERAMREAPDMYEKETPKPRIRRFKPRLVEEALMDDE